MYVKILRLIFLLSFLLIVVFTARPALFGELSWMAGLAEFLAASCGKYNSCSVTLDLLAARAPSLESVVDALWTWVLNIGFNDVLNTLAIGGLLAIGDIAWSWFKFRPMRRLCAQQLYVTSHELITSFSLTLQSISTIDGRRVLEVDADVKDAVFQLALQLQILSDFSIAYEQYFPRKLKRIAVPFRMYVVDAKARIETMIEEIDKSFDPSKNSQVLVQLNEAKYISWVLKKNTLRNRLKYLFQSNKRRERDVDGVFNVLDNAIDLTLYLATRLEGRFRPQKFLGIKLFGRIAPPAIKSTIRNSLYGPRGLFRRAGTKEATDFLTATDSDTDEGMRLSHT